MFSNLKTVGLLSLFLMNVVHARPAKNAKANYVLVGAGPAGFVLAEHLTRNPDVNVVLLEAGANGDDTADVYGMFPTSASALENGTNTDLGFLSLQYPGICSISSIACGFIFLSLILS